MHLLHPIYVKRKELKICQWTPDNRQQTPQTISYLKRLDKIQIQTHINPDDRSETARPPEMTSPDARTWLCKEWRTWKSEHLTQEYRWHRATRHIPSWDELQPCTLLSCWNPSDFQESIWSKIDPLPLPQLCSDHPPRLQHYAFVVIIYIFIWYKNT